MCGICGIAYPDQHPILPEDLAQMNDMLKHRGPDGAGQYCAPGIGLAMRRLSIIDLAGSDQPLYNEDRSIALVFNGEIFNYQALREDLLHRGHRFHTAGDGETIAHLYEEYGTRTPQFLRGQFAFALWDNRLRRLFIARDRMGQKPLYYYAGPSAFVFASEIKAILQHPAVPRESALADPSMLAMFLGYGYVPAPHTAFRDIRALLPGHSLTLEPGHPPQIEAYWSPPPIAPADATAHTRLVPLMAELRDHLETAVRLRLIADVPLGAFLSGGLDSSLIVALMRRHSNAAVRTFSIGFEGHNSWDETRYAEQVSRHLKTDHTAFTVTPSALDLLPALVWHHDQPFADSSAIPTFLVSQLTRQHVTVALTGDGGDELFAGYERFYATHLAQRLQRVPQPIWRAVAGLLARLPEATTYANPVRRAGRFARAASLPLALAYFDWVRVFSADQIAALSHQADSAGADFVRHVPTADLPGILYANMTTYLPDDLQIKTDRCTMQASLEGRSPFMDHHLVEFAAAVPLNLKLHGRTTKYILKETARDLLPADIIDRPKHGFGVPIGEWLRRSPAPVRDLLQTPTTRQRGLLDTQAVDRLIDEHLNGQRDHGHRLWTLLTLEMWHRTFIDQTPTAPALPALV